MSYRQFAANAVANASQDRRINFIRLTYIHLGGAILAFAALCTLRSIRYRCDGPPFHGERHTEYAAFLRCVYRVWHGR